ncbi:MaoC family dehydratase [Acuticoccus sediminis]|uniref:MaoC family dehydratase n=1 Tax=Acuticoccus sediminis TaxID=2184697 RepID=UPI001CFC894B|nr:MaoC family dehydratase [Acuticoccus sediminis]
MGAVTQRWTSDWTRIDDGRTRAYAELTDDFNPIHLDESFAAATPLGRTIAHGTVSLAHLMRHLRDHLGAARTEGGELDIRFRAPVFVGMRVRAVIEAPADAAGPLPVAVEREDGTLAISGTFAPGPHRT